MAVICRQEVFAFCRAEVLQDGDIFVVVYIIIKEMKKVDHIGCDIPRVVCDNCSPYSLRREIVAHK